MLINTLKRGQKMVIDSNIEVVIVAVRGKQVKVGNPPPKADGVNRSADGPTAADGRREGRSSD